MDSSFPPHPLTLDFKHLTALSEISAAHWDALNTDNNPFLKHAFLSGLEIHQCVGEHYGWVPCHLIAFEGDQLVAGLPLYEKDNYYGEFVFDQAWESAWNQVGLPYYPKLVSAVPYTPAHGPRLLIHQRHPRANEIQEAVLSHLKRWVEQKEVSGVHVLFSDQKTQAWLKTKNELIHRLGYQFHWFNREYASFDDFLNQLTPKKRKNIRQERKAIRHSGISFKVLNGHTAVETDWEDFAWLYTKTFLEKYSTPTLNVDFFKHLAMTMPDQIILIVAQYQGQNIAASLLFKSDTRLFGRHWGIRSPVKHLHFETCYYQGIEYAIHHQLSVFEPGAGGEHKIARGFIPVETYSSHWLHPNPFEQALQDFIQREKILIRNYLKDVLHHSPYKDKNPRP